MWRLCLYLPLTRVKREKMHLCSKPAIVREYSLIFEDGCPHYCRESSDEARDTVLVIGFCPWTGIREFPSPPSSKDLCSAGEW